MGYYKENWPKNKMGAPLTKFGSNCNIYLLNRYLLYYFSISCTLFFIYIVLCITDLPFSVPLLPLNII